jgi:hypothetical protein
MTTDATLPGHPPDLSDHPECTVRDRRLRHHRLSPMTGPPGRRAPWLRSPPRPPDGHGRRGRHRQHRRLAGADHRARCELPGRSARTGFGAAVLPASRTRRPSGRRSGEREWIWLLHDVSPIRGRWSTCSPRSPAIRSSASQARSRLVRPAPAARGRRHDRPERPSRALLDGASRTGPARFHPQVLAVNTAGLLIRRDVWDELAGP